MSKLVKHQLKERELFNQLKDDFLSRISHELRSPMTNIKMATRMLKLIHQQKIGGENSSTHFFVDQEQPAFKSKVDHYLLILEQECDREMSLLNNFLDLQQLDAGNYHLNQTTACLQESIPHVIKPFFDRIKNQQQILHLDIAKNLPILTIDQTSLERILTELLGNACKFTPMGGSITVKLCTKLPSTKSLETLQLKVSNSGIEIPLSEQAQIFERFYRIPGDDRWKYPGTGLGLTLVKKLVEHLGGLIRVESSTGKTCFIVEVPVGI